MDARTGRVLARAPLGAAAEAALRRALLGDPSRRPAGGAARRRRRRRPTSRFSSAPRSTSSPRTMTASRSRPRTGWTPSRSAAIALVGADGLWSRLRKRLGHSGEPRFARHTAWRALGSGRRACRPSSRAPAVNLWLGRNAHLVHYPVRGGALINVVAILRDDWREPGWSAAGARRDVLDRFPAGMWQAPARELICAPPSMAEMGAVRLRAAARTGARGRSRCSATRRIRCCPISRRAPPWRSRTRPCSRNASRARPTIPPAPLRAYEAQAPRGARRARNAPPAATAPSITWAAPKLRCARSRSWPWAATG